MRALMLLLAGTSAVLAQNPPRPVPAPAAPPLAAPASGASIWAPPPATATNFWAAQLRSVRRVVSGRTIDISSLVRWQMNPVVSERPLKAWVWVTGRLGPQTAYGTQVTGYLDAEPQARPFLVRGLPADIAAEFNRLKQSHRALMQSQSAVNVQLEQAQKLLEQTDAEYQRMGYIRFGGDLLDQRREAVNRLRAEATRITQALQSFDVNGQDLGGEFVLRCFAVKTGQTFNGMPVYDHGFVLR